MHVASLRPASLAAARQSLAICQSPLCPGPRRSYAMRSIMTYVLWRGVVWWRCMELLMNTVHKHVYTTMTCCSIATNQWRRDPEEFGQTVMIDHASPGTPQSLLKLIHIRRVFTGGEVGVGPPPGPCYRHALCDLHVCPSHVLTWRRPCRWHSQYTVARHYCYCSFLLNHNGIY